MVERHPGELPVPSPAVLQALKGIYSGLYVIRSQYAIDQGTGEVQHDPLSKEPVEKPRYWVCNDHRGKKSLLFPIEDLEGNYMPCDMRVVKRIGTDLGIVTETAAEMLALLDAQDDRREAQRRGDEKERVRRFIENNGPAIRRAMENAKKGIVSSHPMSKMRDPVLYSYNGQPLRKSSFNTIPMTAKERGIDTPEN